jgi:tagaturonate epimerase
MKPLAKYTFGVGDRFAHQASAQLEAFRQARELGWELVPVWNKSNREHLTVGSRPPSVLAAAEAAVDAADWQHGFYIDADHIGITTVEPFLSCSDFFTLDVADWIGKAAPADAIDAFVKKHHHLVGRIELPGLSAPMVIDETLLRSTAEKYLAAAIQAGATYRHILQAKRPVLFVTEVSMDETDAPQTPPELLIILAALADHGVPAQTIAPKFTGRFNKGVDYVGDVAQFEREFRDDLAVIAHAVATFGLPAGLKLSVHSGSDKFSIYPAIRDAIRDTGAGLHIKTAGTTWIEEVIGLAESGGEGLEIAKDIYRAAYEKCDSLCAPYAAVIDIDPARLPDPAEVATWPADRLVAALRHDPTCKDFNADLRQLIHVGYKVAAQMGERYTDGLVACREAISRNVTGNLLDRHMKPLFGG